VSDLHQLIIFLGTGSNWTGPGGLVTRLIQHLQLTAVAVAIACLIALPLGIWLGHIGRGGILAVNVSNVGRAIPTFAVLVLFFLQFGDHRYVETVAALVLFAVAPILTNTYVGVRDVDPDVVEASRGMGMSGSQLVKNVEVPLAAPLILAGIRIAVVQVVATATIAAYIGGGGLGRLVLDGFTQRLYGQVLAGALFVALLALALDAMLALLARCTDPYRRARRLQRRAAPTVRPAGAG
jgi:osmoprotectant transport system permease protein